MSARLDFEVPPPATPTKVARELARRPLTFREQRVLWREGHLCLACAHHHVCAMNRALDPNYLVVIVEGIALPLVHTAWITALVFTVLNAILLFGFRIPTEERALAALDEAR